jgi:hypothetical protein
MTVSINGAIISLAVLLIYSSLIVVRWQEGRGEIVSVRDSLSIEELLSKSLGKQRRR